MNEYEQLLINAIIIAKLISEEMKDNQTYENIVKIADDLKIEPFQVHEFLQLYKHAQQFMVI